MTDKIIAPLENTTDNFDNFVKYTLENKNMSSYLYAPILRFKRGELRALEKLDKKVKTLVLPLFVISGDDYNEGSLNLLPEKFFLETDSDYTFNKIKEFCDYNNKQIIKVYNNTINLNTDEEFCLHMSVNNELPEMDIDTKNGFLILDFEDKQIEGALLKIILNALNTIVKKKWKKVYIAASSIPSTLPSGQTLVDRYDFNTLYQEALNKWSDVGFSDYGITGLGNDIDVPIEFLRPAAKIRYTLKDKFFLIKGKSIKTTGTSQYKNLSNIIVNSGFFMGNDFSWGDEFINICSDNLSKNSEDEKNGNLETWVVVDTNHHITFVVKQLSNQL